MTKSSSLDYTTSRISRLLRPLRLKCNVLAASSSPSSGRSHGSGSQTANVTRRDTLSREHEQPLAIIPPPEKLRALSHLDRASRANIQLSKMLYDVRDAFRNVLQAVHGSSPGHRKPASAPVVGQDRIRRLSAFCASVLGEHIEEQVELTKDGREDDDAAEEDDLDIVNEYYEAVPEHHRKHTIISHALTIVLSTCPSNHTVYSLLLDLTLSYGLISESKSLLCRLLEVACTPMPTSPAGGEGSLSMTLSVHSAYLTSLRDRFCKANVINDRAFAFIVRQVLQAGPSHLVTGIWDCKAIVRLARRFRSHDFESFIILCSALVHDVSTLRPTTKGKEREDSDHTLVRDRLAKWLEMLCERLINTSNVVEDDTEAHQEFLAITKLLTSAQAAGLHKQNEHSTACKAVADALLSLTVLCCSSSHYSVLCKQDADALLSILREYRSPDVDTFNPVTSITLSNISKEDSGSYALTSAQATPSVQLLCRWGLLLHTKQLYLLEAWFWSNALAHVEDLCPEIGTHYNTNLHRSAFADELERLRKRIVKNIEAAEKKYYDDCDQKTSSRVDQTPSKAASAIKGSEFRWEELVGCWVQKTPLPVKKSRLTAKRPRDTEPDNEAHDITQMLNDHVSKRPRVYETPSRKRAPSVSSNSSLSSAYATSRSSRMSLSLSPRRSVTSSRLTTPHDEQENIKGEEEREARAPNSVPKLKVKTERRQSGFTSVLADARSNRIVLHAQEKPGTYGDSAQGLPVVPRPQKRPAVLALPRKPVEARNIHLGAMEANEPSSDDLDLFAYRSSEW
ncbi:hypothetical protein BDW22DRAFT_1354707 [Trametopsis cervina]|nr:hypothetical protein BDW22DRAFT_1354707 [Trametopsis cervina]